MLSKQGRALSTSSIPVNLALAWVADDRETVPSSEKAMRKRRLAVDFDKLADPAFLAFEIRRLTELIENEFGALRPRNKG